LSKIKTPFSSKYYTEKREEEAAFLREFLSILFLQGKILSMWHIFWARLILCFGNLHILPKIGLKLFLVSYLKK